MAKGKKSSFDSQLDELERVLRELENEQSTVEDSLNAFEKGVALVRNAQNRLTEAEQKLNTLLEEPIEQEPPGLTITSPSDEPSAE